MSRSDLRASAKERICRLTSLTCTPSASGVPGQAVGGTGAPIGDGSGVGASAVSSVAFSASSLIQYVSNQHEGQ